MVLQLGKHGTYAFLVQKNVCKEIKVVKNEKQNLVYKASHMFLHEIRRQKINIDHANSFLSSGLYSIAT